MKGIESKQGLFPFFLLKGLDMENYASNSNKSKNAAASEPSKKVNKVVSNTAKVKKKSEAQKIADVFISEDVENVKEYIVGDVLIPAVKKAISDIVITGIEMLLYGNTRPRTTGNPSRVQYQSYWDRQNASRAGQANSSGQIGLNYNNITYATRADAEAVLGELLGLIREYGVASIADLYSASNIPYSNYTYNDYGWRDLSIAKTYPVKDGYMIKLPKASPL